MARMLMVLMAFILVVDSSLQFKLKIPDEVHPVCSGGSCGGVSYEYLLNQYPGLLLTEEEAHDVLKKKVPKKEPRNRVEMLYSYSAPKQGFRIPGDGDMCCTTDRIITMNFTMVNMAGVVRSLIHMPELSRYQFVQQGRCIKYGWNCPGKCVLEPWYLSLLIHDPKSTNNPPITFDTFEVPRYCSCKNISPHH